MYLMGQIGHMRITLQPTVQAHFFNAEWRIYCWIMDSYKRAPTHIPCIRISDMLVVYSLDENTR